MLLSEGEPKILARVNLSIFVSAESMHSPKNFTQAQPFGVCALSLSFSARDDNTVWSRRSGEERATNANVVRIFVYQISIVIGPAGGKSQQTRKMRNEELEEERHEQKWYRNKYDSEEQSGERGGSACRSAFEMIFFNSLFAGILVRSILVKWILTLDEISVSVGDDSCNEKWMWALMRIFASVRKWDGDAEGEERWKWRKPNMNWRRWALVWSESESDCGESCDSVSSVLEENNAVKEEERIGNQLLFVHPRRSIQFNSTSIATNYD